MLGAILVIGAPGVRDVISIRGVKRVTSVMSIRCVRVLGILCELGVL